MSAADLEDWVNDQDAPVCHLCYKEFTLFFRRHHCRICGNVICAECSSNTLPLLASKGSSGNLSAQGALTPSKQKVCDKCFACTSKSQINGKIEHDEDGENSCLDTSDEEDAQASEDPIIGRRVAQNILDSVARTQKSSGKKSSKVATLKMEAKAASPPRSPTALGSVTNTVLPPSAIPMSKGDDSLFKSLYGSNIEYLGPILHLIQLMVFSHPRFQAENLCSFYESFEALPVFKYLQLGYRVGIIMSLSYWAIVGAIQVLMFMGVCYPFQLVFSQYLDLSGDISLSEIKTYADNIIIYLTTYFNEGICATELHSVVNNNWILSDGSLWVTFWNSFNGLLMWRISQYLFFLALKCLFFVILTLPWKKLKTSLNINKKKQE